MRIYWLSQCIYVSTIALNAYAPSPYVQPIFGFLLSCLLMLHIYWQYLMIGIIMNYAKKGVAEDTVNDMKHITHNSSTTPVRQVQSASIQAD